MTFFGRRVFFIGAHPDDIELGAGALIAHIVGQTDVLCITLSDNQKNPALTKVVEEHQRSMAVLGVPPQNVIVGEFETRRFPHFRQEILEYLIELKNRYQPEIVFTHTEADIHQDHATVTEECLRAFRGTTVLGFDVLRSSYGFFPNFLVEVTEKDVEARSTPWRNTRLTPASIISTRPSPAPLLIRHGALAERPYAEGFDILRVIGAFGCIKM